eukprot:644950_1
MALQTREQHIKRERATSNICTAQALLANVSAAYAIYHGPNGLKEIAERTNTLSRVLAAGCRKLGLKIVSENFFDTIQINTEEKWFRTSDTFIEAAREKQINLRAIDDENISISFDETTTPEHVDELLSIFAEVLGKPSTGLTVNKLLPEIPGVSVPPSL